MRRITDVISTVCPNSIDVSGLQTTARPGEWCFPVSFSTTERSFLINVLMVERLTSVACLGHRTSPTQSCDAFEAFLPHDLSDELLACLLLPYEKLGKTDIEFTSPAQCQLP